MSRTLDVGDPASRGSYAPTRRYYPSFDPVLPMNQLLGILSRRYGNAEWDVVVRASGVVALVALYPTIRWPAVAGLVGFFCLTLVVSGPLTLVVPAMFEPMLMVAGRVYPPLLVTLVAVTGHVSMDYMNYHFFGAAIRHPRLEKAKNSRLVRRLLVLFQRSPFFVIWLCAWSPIPFWIASTLASLSRYSKRKYVLATFLGRAPRIWFFTTLGLFIPVSSRVLGTYVACAVVVGVAIVALRRRATSHTSSSAAPRPPASGSELFPLNRCKSA